MNNIHETAIIHDNVEIGDGNYIGAYTVIGSPPEIKDGFPRQGKVIIGDNCVITSHVTIDAGKGQPTVIGNDCFIMTKAHIGHNAQLGNRVIISAQALVGGYVVIEDFVNMGVGSKIHQRRTIGKGCMIGMGAIVTRNTGVWTVYKGVPAKAGRFNKSGAERSGENMAEAEKAWYIYYKSC